LLAEAQAEAARAAVAGARAALDQMRLRAPFAGVVTARLADPGTVAAPGVPLLQVDRDGPLQAQVTLDESLLGRIRTGMTLPVELASSARPIAGTVAEIAPGADPASRSFLVKLNLPATPAARAGVSVTVALPGAVQSVVEAPVAAIVHREALDYVYVLDAHAIARLRYVTLGAREGDRVVVLSGLEAGERLVAGAGDRDLAGQPIEAQ
jgi:RND family efflux transporter MFP subunit